MVVLVVPVEEHLVTALEVLEILQVLLPVKETTVERVLMQVVALPVAVAALLVLEEMPQVV
jgi:hypothetical protein